MPAVTRTPRTPLEQRPILKVLDYDQTTNTPSNPAGRTGTRDALLRDSNNSIDVECSGRGATMARALAKDLDGFPLDGFSTNNGNDLFVNWHGRPARDFVGGLKVGDARSGWDAGWQKVVQQKTGGWNVLQVRDMMVDDLKQRGFQPAEPLPAPRDSFTCLQKTIDGQKVLVAVPPDQPGYQVRCPDGPVTHVHQQFGLELQKSMQQRLEAQGIKHTTYALAEGKFETRDDRFTHQFTPEGVGKADLTDYLATIFPGVRAVIAAGDGPNDTHIELRTAGPQHAPVFAIMAGDEHPNADRVRTHPRLECTPAGDIGTAIDKHTEAIHDTMQSYPHRLYTVDPYAKPPQA